MILHPAIIALLSTSAIAAGMLLYACSGAVQILVHWDLCSGSELQLRLERKTYLISTILCCLFALQIASLFLFIFTADNIHPLFVGAMCAAGTLNLNAYGYPALLLKVATALLAGLWLLLNHTDNRAYDYPLIRKKYSLLLLLTPLVLTEMAIQAMYLVKLRPNIITSCCGSLFGKGSDGLSADLGALPALPMMAAYYLCMSLLITTGLFFLRRGKFGKSFSLLAVTVFPVSVASLISCFSLYFYELPSHHCPFDILHREYGHIGYLLYAALLGGTITGAGVGMLMPCRKITSLSAAMSGLQQRLALASITSFSIFTAVVSWQAVFSGLSLRGY